MNTIEVNTKTSHYWLFKTFTGRDERELLRSGGMDICMYGQVVFCGIFLLLFFFVIGTLLTIGVVDAILGGVFSLIHGTWMMGKPGEALLVLMAIIAVFLMSAWAIISINHYRDLRSSRPPGFISTYIDSVKNRYCVKIKLGE